MQNNTCEEKHNQKTPRTVNCMKLRVLNYYSSAILTQSRGQQSEKKLETLPVSLKNETKQYFDTKFVPAPPYSEYLHLALFEMG